MNTLLKGTQNFAGKKKKKKDLYKVIIFIPAKNVINKERSKSMRLLIFKSTMKPVLALNPFYWHYDLKGNICGYI